MSHNSPDATRNSPLLDVSVVVPVFNERETVDVFLDHLTRVFDSDASVRLEILFVNDGSTDETLDRLLLHQQTDHRIRVVDLSRHFGKEAALAAGLQTAMGRLVVPIDVDLQDPPELIRQMIGEWRKGYDVVLGRRINRGADSWFKRTCARWFYRIHNQLAESEIPENVGDFRLIDRAVVDALNALPESRRFMKGLFAWVGFSTTFLDYARRKRVAGSSKFKGWRLWNLALEGLTGFSTVPLRLWSYLGFVVAFASLLYGAYIVFGVLSRGVDVPGYASLFAALTFLGGLQLLGIGVLGEYLGRTYLESKRRPIFIVRRIHEPPH